MRYQVVLNLAPALKKRIEVDGAEFVAQQLEMNAQHVVRLAEGGWTDITRDQMQRLSAWARTHEFDPNLFSFGGPHPLWEPFAEKSAMLFVGRNSDRHINKDDADAQAILTRFLADDRCGVSPEHVDQPSDEKGRRPLGRHMRESMMNHNCIVVCGPRRNPASEVAVSLLWDAEPFNSSSATRQRLPFHITYYGGANESVDSAFSSIDNKPEHRGIVVSNAWHLPFPYKPDVQWRMPSQKPTFDFAVIAMCRKPLDTTKEVSTLVIMGLTGFATKAACTSIAAEELCVESLADGAPELRVFCAKFKKGVGRDSRRLTDGCRWVGAPWDYWPTGAAKRLGASKSSK